MDKLNRIKGSLKAKITKLELFLQAFEQSSNSDVELNVKLGTTRELKSKLDELQLQYFELPKEMNIKESETDIQEIDTRLESLEIGISIRLKQLKMPNSNNTVGDVSQRNYKQDVKLPEIPLPSFSGRYEEWNMFKDQFDNVISNNSTLTENQKLFYLKAALKGECRQIETSDDSFESLFKALESRYENKRAIVDSHVQAIINYEKLQHESFKDIRNLLDCMNKNIRALKLLNFERNDLSDIMIINIICQKLDKETRKQWEISVSTKKVPKLDNLLSFLEKRSIIIENINKNALKPTYKLISNQVIKKPNSFIMKTKDVNFKTCAFCNGSHYLSKCLEFQNMSIPNRFNFVKEQKLCLNCLNRNHLVLQCKSKFSCFICKKRHHSMLCRNKIQEKVESTCAQNTNSQDSLIVQSDTSEDYSTKGKQNEVISTSMSTHQTLTSVYLKRPTILLSTAWIWVEDKRGNKNKFRCILDSASQINLISSHCANELGLKREKIFAPIMGINNIMHTATSKVRTHISDAKGNFHENIELCIVPKITDLTPSVKLDISEIQLSNFIELADPEFFTPQQIHILLGAELFFELLRSDKIRVKNSNLLLVETALGYLVTGSLPIEQTQQCCLLSKETETLEQTLKKFWEIESIDESPKLTNKSEEERFCEEHFVQTHQRDTDGRYVVKLPIKENVNLGESLTLCKKTLNSLWYRLDKNDSMQKLYKEFICEYEKLGHMEEIKVSDRNSIQNFLPHHGVFRPDSRSTKLRVVFNASAPTTNGYSLNDCLMKGGMVQEELFSIMLRFRKHKYAFACDIQKMYRQIKIHPTQCDLQCITWKDGLNTENKFYKLLTVTYGTKSAPFLATRVLNQLAIDEQTRFPQASAAINDFYVDDILSGAEDLSRAQQLKSELIQMLDSCGMKLHKWCSNDKSLITQDSIDKQSYQFNDTNESQTVKTLGVKWNYNLDCFIFHVNFTKNSNTKRSILADIAKIFDPLGLLGPIITKAKVFMQQLWILKLDWHEPLPDKEINFWKEFIDNSININDIKVDRFILSDDIKRIELHGFADASQLAYAAVIYVKCISNSNECTVKLLCSKSRVAPLKVITIPRLELSAALLLSQLVNVVVKSLKITFDQILLWSDSTIVLSWIKTEPYLLKTFVANRVSKIQSLTHEYPWCHITSKENPADLVSRGLYANQLINNFLWWQGPMFLKEKIFICPNKSNVLFDEKGYITELKKTNCMLLNVKSTNNCFLDGFLSISNSYTKLLRILSFVFRFAYNIKNKSKKKAGPITLEEINQSKNFLIFQVQLTHFYSEIKDLSEGKNVMKSKLHNLNPFIDKSGILRVGGRLQHSNLNFDKKHPIILPAEHKLTLAIFAHFHIKNLHIGPQGLLHMIRQEFWPLNGRNLARKVVHQCVICFKNKPTNVEQVMGNLPSERVNSKPAFNISGIDFAGPFFIKYKGQRKGSYQKVYVCIFICLVTRAIHIEAVTDLTTEAFISSLKRFFARRGKSSKIFTDNAKNFVGAHAELKRLYKHIKNPSDHLVNYLVSEEIAWKFIPPKSPNFGGLWEAGVKSFKHHLRRTVGDCKLTLEEFITVITQIEGILNSRPMTPLSSDPNDFNVLTPGHFLIGQPITSIPDIEVTNKPDNYLSRWQRTTKMVQIIWKRWHLDYLNHLHLRNKWKFQKNNIEINSMVLLKEENLPPYKWVIGRIKNTILGSDGKVRVVIVKTPKGEFKRGISKICPLPISHN